MPFSYLKKLLFSIFLFLFFLQKKKIKINETFKLKLEKKENIRGISRFSFFAYVSELSAFILSLFTSYSVSSLICRGSFP